MFTFAIVVLFLLLVGLFVWGIVALITANPSRSNYSSRTESSWNAPTYRNTETTTYVVPVQPYSSSRSSDSSSGSDYTPSYSSSNDSYSSSSSSDSSSSDSGGGYGGGDSGGGGASSDW